MMNPFPITPLNPSHLEQVLRLQQQVLDSLPDPNLLRRNTDEMILSCLSCPHYSLGAWKGEELVALAILYVPQTSDEDLSLRLRTVDASRYKAADYKLCMVRPDCRGYHLQRVMGQMLIEKASEWGYNLIAATASPDNSFSHNSLIQLGFQVDSQAIFYGGLHRQLYYLTTERNNTRNNNSITYSPI